jgi:hypothetical protein
MVFAQTKTDDGAVFGAFPDATIPDSAKPAVASS